MRILHINISGPFNENGTYQENFIPGEHANMGHEVILWTSCYEWDGIKKQKVPEVRKKMDNGVILQRWEYRKIVNEWVAEKIRAIPHTYEKLDKEHPDFIMLHGGQTAIVTDVCKYVADNPKVRVVMDNHADSFNSAQNMFSKWILHKLFYRHYMKKAYAVSGKVFYISEESKDTLTGLYGLPEEKMQCLPLGGKLLNDEDYMKKRIAAREKLLIKDDIISIVHSGKLYPEKKTAELLEVIKKIDSPNIHLTIIGSAEGEVLNQIKIAAQEDERITWLGWKKGEELIEYLCGGDVYVLPGDLSATVQSAMFCRCAVLVYPYKNYTSMNLCRYSYVENSAQLEENISHIINEPDLLDKMRDEAFRYALEYLDYSKQAERILRE